MEVRAALSLVVSSWMENTLQLAVLSGEVEFLWPQQATTQLLAVESDKTYLYMNSLTSIHRVPTSSTQSMHGGQMPPSVCSGNTHIGW